MDFCLGSLPTSSSTLPAVHRFGTSSRSFGSQAWSLLQTRSHSMSNCENLGKPAWQSFLPFPLVETSPRFFFFIFFFLSKSLN